MKKDRQRRIIKRKKPANDFVSVLTGHFVSGLASALIQAAATITIEIHVVEKKQPENDQDLQYCNNCKTYYKDKCSCQPKQLPPSV